MFGLFRSKKEKKKELQLMDIDSTPLHEGDMVHALRYDLGKSVLRKDSEGYYYESVASGKKVHFSLMIDAVTSRQKVEKIENN
ncbi:MAG: hypothetical protein U5K79_08105 [Cyclobacteriaceae bacterium]|nr:hypothetical protein [Cyclobacteriaceae bacterium]